MIYIIYGFFFLWALLLLFVVTSAFVGFVRTGVPYVRTSKADIELLARELGIASPDVFLDLGSGDGSVLFWVEKLTGARVKGFELTGWSYWLTKVKKIYKKSEVKLERKDFFQQSWSDVTIVYAYLYPFLMAKVEEKFLADCRHGAVAAVRDFPFPTLKPFKILFIPVGSVRSGSRYAALHYTPWQRFILLLKSMGRFGADKQHEIYIYKKG